MSPKSARSMLDVDDGNEPKIGQINATLTIGMSPKLAKLTMDLKNGNGAKINKFNNIG